MKSISYVIKENIDNWYRIFSIARYEVLADYRDSRLGLLWMVLDPVIQIFAYWFAFGLGIRGGAPVNGIEFINWMLAGIIPWFFISTSIRRVTTSIHQKSKVITKMKFPISILPTTEVFKALFTHFVTLVVMYVFLLFNGVSFNVYHFTLLYYIFCSFAFCVAFGMLFSVLNMFTRDVKKGVNASIRLLMFMTPILWTMDNLPSWIQMIMKCNPLYYIIEGYRNSLFYYESIWSRPGEMLVFWTIVIGLFTAGSVLMYKFKHRFIDYM